MQAPDGGFYAALDADSEGHEGRYYVWRRDEVESLLSPDEYRVLASRYGLDREPNFEGEWHLHVFANVDPADAGLLRSARAKLFAARERRVRPGLDDKILTAWNGLMIRGLAVSGRLLAEPAHVDAAVRAVDFIRANCWKDGELFASWKDGEARFPAYLDDHAFLLDALLEVMQSHFRVEDLDFARRARRRAAGEIPGPRAWRLLVHCRGSGPAAPSPEELCRRLDGRRQRDRGFRARPPRLAAR